MTTRLASRVAAGILAAALLLPRPLIASAQQNWDGEDFEILAGTAEPELSESSELPSYAENVRDAQQRALSYLAAATVNPTVNTIGGEWSVLSLARGGKLEENTRTAYLGNLLKTLDETSGRLSRIKYTEYSRVILAVSALGMDARNVGGYDLVQPLADFDKVKLQGINGPIWALIALDSGHFPVPVLKEGQGTVQTSREGILDFLLECQLDGGGWALGGEADSSLEPDDLCPMAISALAPYYSSPEVKAAVDLALSRWSSRQDSSGGFGDNADTGKGGSEAVSQTIIALSALDVSLVTGEAFTKNGHNLLESLLSYQLPDGSFCHVHGGASNAMATDQAVLAMLAYTRALHGNTALFDMQDVLNLPQPPVPTEPAETTAPTEPEVSDTPTEPSAPAPEENREKVQQLREKLAEIPDTPNLSHKDSIYALLAQVELMKDFPEKQAVKARLGALKEKIGIQMAQVEALDRDIWEQIRPADIQASDRPKVEALRQRYQALPVQNRPYVEHAGDLFYAEEKLLELENGTEVIPGEKPEPVPRPEEDSVTVTESNTVILEIQNELIRAENLAEIQGQARNLRLEGILANGLQYAVIINGKDITEPKPLNAGVILGGFFESDIRMLAQEPVIFRLNQEGTFPAPILLELPVTLADGTYMLVQYVEGERRAQPISKVTVANGLARMVLDRGGEYFLARRVSTKSAAELENARPEQSAEPTQPHPTQTEPAYPEETQEMILPGTQARAGLPPVGILLLYGLAVIVVIGIALYLRKGKK